MSAAGEPDAAAAPRAAPARGPALLDAGTARLAPESVAALIDAARAGRARPCGQDRNATCFAAGVTGVDGTAHRAVLKVARTWPGRTNPDTSFAAEARNLARLSALGVGAMPRLLGRFRWHGEHFLLMTHVRGRPPHPRENPLTRPQLRALAGACAALDALGFLHYDLNPSNVLTESDDAHLVDFEFGRFEGGDARAPARPLAWSADYNAGTNPHWPDRSNIANFEFRALHRHLDALGTTGEAERALELLEAWVREKAGWHAARAGRLRALHATYRGSDAARSLPLRASTRARLARAAAHEDALAGACAAPDASMLEGERRLAAARFARFMGTREQTALALAALADWVRGVDARSRAHRAHRAGVAWALRRLVAMPGR